MYTGFRLKEAYMAFFLITFFQFATHLISKFCVRKFMYSKITPLKELIKCSATSVLISDPVDDWDAAEIPTRKMRQNTIFEAKVGILVNWVFNMMCLVPLFITGTNIIDRHQVLNEINIAIKDTEASSYKTVIRMMIVTPMVVTLAALMEYLLMRMFHFSYHPWVGVFEDEHGDREPQTETIELQEIKTETKSGKDLEKKEKVEEKEDIAEKQNIETANECFLKAEQEIELDNQRVKENKGNAEEEEQNIEEKEGDIEEKENDQQKENIDI